MRTGPYTLGCAGGFPLVTSGYVAGIAVDLGKEKRAG